MGYLLVLARLACSHVNGSGIAVGTIIDHRRVPLPEDWGKTEQETGLYRGVAEEDGLVGGSAEEMQGGCTVPQRDVKKFGEIEVENAESRPNRATTQYLVKWEGASYIWATWETDVTLKAETFRTYQLKVCSLLRVHAERSSEVKCDPSLISGREEV